jgi:hypothetical protein
MILVVEAICTSTGSSNAQTSFLMFIATVGCVIIVSIILIQIMIENWISFRKEIL